MIPRILEPTDRVHNSRGPSIYNRYTTFPVLTSTGCDVDGIYHSHIKRV